MKRERPAQEYRRVSWMTVIVTVALLIIAGLTLFAFCAVQFSDKVARVLKYVPFGVILAVVVVVVLHSKHETRVTRQVVAAALKGRPRLAREDFGARFYGPAVAPVASHLRGLLAGTLDCDLSGPVPGDDFQSWLCLFPGPDSAADAFFEDVAVEFELSRDCPWPERFESFDTLVRFVVQNSPAAKMPSDAIPPSSDLPMAGAAFRLLEGTTRLSFPRDH